MPTPSLKGTHRVCLSKRAEFYLGRMRGKNAGPLQEQ